MPNLSITAVYDAGFSSTSGGVTTTTNLIKYAWGEAPSSYYHAVCDIQPTLRCRGPQLFSVGALASRVGLGVPGRIQFGKTLVYPDNIAGDRIMSSATTPTQYYNLVGHYLPFYGTLFTQMMQIEQTSLSTQMGFLFPRIPVGSFSTPLGNFPVVSQAHTPIGIASGFLYNAFTIGESLSPMLSPYVKDDTNISPLVKLGLNTWSQEIIDEYPWILDEPLPVVIGSVLWRGVFGRTIADRGAVQDIDGNVYRDAGSLNKQVGLRGGIVTVVRPRNVYGVTHTKEACTYHPKLLATIETYHPTLSGTFGYNIVATDTNDGSDVILYSGSMSVPGSAVLDWSTGPKILVLPWMTDVRLVGVSGISPSASRLTITSPHAILPPHPTMCVSGFTAEPAPGSEDATPPISLVYDAATWNPGYTFVVNGQRAGTYHK